MNFISFYSDLFTKQKVSLKEGYFLVLKEPVEIKDLGKDYFTILQGS